MVMHQYTAMSRSKQNDTFFYCYIYMYIIFVREPLGSKFGAWIYYASRSVDRATTADKRIGRFPENGYRSAYTRLKRIDVRVERITGQPLVHQSYRTLQAAMHSIHYT